MNKNEFFFKRLFSCIRERRSPAALIQLYSKFKNLFRPYPYITVEASSICNVRCVWCFMYYSEKKDMGVMSFENFKKFIDLNARYLSSHNIKLYLHHRGEALLNERYFDMADYARDHCVALKNLHTNLSLHFDIKRLMGSSIPEIIVNIGGTTPEVNGKVMKGSDLELVKSNLIEMFRLNKLNKKIFLKMNPVKDNVHQINDLPDFFKRLGGDPKNIIANWPIEFITPAEATRQERVEFLRNVVSGEVKDYLNFTYDEEGNISSKMKVCKYISPCVRWDGKVSACCQDKFGRFNLGNAFEVPIEKIIKRKEFRIAVRRGRKKEFWFCKDCN